MTVVVAQRGPDPADVEVTVPGLRRWRVTLQPPELMDAQGPALFRWYFEDRLYAPGLDADRERAATVAMRRYGHSLWRQLFDDDERAACAREAGGITVQGSAALQALHWELVADPTTDRSVALEHPVVRRVEPNVDTGPPPAEPAATRILMVTARPDGRDDVAYRTVAPRVVEQVGPPASVRVLRPPTFAALQAAVAAAAAACAPFGVVHIDAHADVLSDSEIAFRHWRYHVPDDQTRAPSQDPGRRPFLLLETDRNGRAHPVGADDLAAVLTGSGVSIVVLTACRSAMMAPGVVTSICHQLAEAGVTAVLGMSHRVSVTAVELLVKPLSEVLLGGGSLANAVTAARRALAAAPQRRGVAGREVAIEDWSLLVAYEQSDRHGGEPRRQIHGSATPLAPMKGRDLELLSIDRMIGTSASRHVLVNGVLGSGKTAFLRHLADWWTRTGVVRSVVVVSMDGVGSHDAEYALGLIVDAVVEAGIVPLDTSLGFTEALAGSDIMLAIDDAQEMQILPVDDRRELLGFFGALTANSAIVVYASRGYERWLGAETFGDDVLELGPLDAVAFAEMTRVAALPEVDPPLLTLPLHEATGGLPGVIDAVGALEPGQASDLVTAVVGGWPQADTELSTIDIVVARAEPEVRAALPYLAPLTRAAPVALIESHRARLRVDDEREATDVGYTAPFLDVALAELVELGLARELTTGAVSIHPLLRAWLHHQPGAEGSRPEWARTWLIEAAGLWTATISEEPGRRRRAWQLVRAYLPDLESAARQGAHSGHDPAVAFNLVAEVLMSQHRWADVSSLARDMRTCLQLVNASHIAVAGAVDLEARAALALGDLGTAQTLYTEALGLCDGDDALSASIYVQLGLIAQRVDLDSAAGHYRRARTLATETDVVAGRATQQLGRVAQEKGDFEAAERLFAEARLIFSATGDLSSESSSLHQMAIVAQQSGDLTRAEELCRKSIALRELTGDAEGVTRSRHQLSIIQQGRGDPDAAERTTRRVIADCVARGDRHHEAWSLLRLAELLHQGDPPRDDEAARLLASALASLGEIDDQPLRAWIHSLRGETLTVCGRMREAVADTVRALQIRSWFATPVGQDATWLNRQRNALGSAEMANQLRVTVGNEAAETLSTAFGW